jgi:hypothetical protein
MQPSTFARSCLALIVAMGIALGLGSSAAARPTTDKAALNALAERFDRDLRAHRGAQYARLLASTSPAQVALNVDEDVQLIYVDGRGRPFYYTTTNLIAAQTVSTDEVWPGGSGGFGLTGSSTSLGLLGEWDAGGVLTTHQEFATGRVTQMDSPSGTHYHSTHVAGILVAGGVQAAAKGMSYQANLAAYDWGNDNTEMATAAANGMNLSNHSYGYITGWYWDSGDSQWYWWGDTDVDPVEDFYFGFYSDAAQGWDEIAHDAPYYLIVISAGNDRNDFGPSPGGGHWVWDNMLGDWVWSTDTRDPDGGSDGYDCLAHMAVAKNVLSVGAIGDIPGGWTDPSDVVMSVFSCWGPTDDGRIKPDIVANGIGLYSCTNASNTSYASYSGTSMSSPNACGSINLLVRLFENTHSGAEPLSSTMKAVVVETADEAGAATGPDYANGWGLLNTLHAAELIDADGALSGAQFKIREDSLTNGDADTLYFSSTGAEPVRLTMAWTDPEGTPPSFSLNPTTLMLVNDLDLRVKHMESSTTYAPYILDPSNPGDAATTGDNSRDNVEQVYVASPPAGHYMVLITHKGTLPSGGQWYSLASSEALTAEAPDLTDPVVEVTAPNGGEVLYIGGTFEITWTAADAGGVDSVSMVYSVDSGATYPDTIATGEPNDSSYMWLVPDSPSSTCKVKVVAYDPSMNTGEDESDAVFTIAQGPATPATSPWSTLALALLVVCVAALALLRLRRKAAA